MRECANCGRGYYMPERSYMIDEWLCRLCQKNPAVQVRVLLGRARAQSFDFARAWEFALGCTPGGCPGGRVRWVHDTDHRRQWKAVFEDPEVIETWRAAYQRESVAQRDGPLALLAVA